jgi:hypothetical protein
MTHQQTMERKIELFIAAMEQFIRTLEGAHDATRAPKQGGWNAAQIGWHVAKSNELLSGALTGAVSMAQPVPPEFQEDPHILSKVPARIQTFPQLEPPADVSAEAALADLRASMGTTITAFRSLTEERARGHFIQFPMGPLTLYQFADFTVGHVSRHQQQLEQALK